MSGSVKDVRELLPDILRLHDRIREKVRVACLEQTVAQLSTVAREAEDDTLYAVDAMCEDVLIEEMTRLAARTPVVLIAEGLPGGSRVLPETCAPEDCAWRIIVDPVDGTRGLMYQKRSAWVLTGVAPNRGPSTSLEDIALAVQTEIPLVKQYLADRMWAIPGEGVVAERHDCIRREGQPLELQPSTADGIAHGYATVSRFFPGGRDELASIDDEIASALLGPPEDGKASCFEDQYASTGGQLYELMAGHDRFVADLRPLMRSASGEGRPARRLCCHPYDICVELIARERGVIVTRPDGAPLDAPLDVDSDVAWVGYANAGIRDRVEGVLQESLRRRGLLP